MYTEDRSKHKDIGRKKSSSPKYVFVCVRERDRGREGKKKDREAERDERQSVCVGN